VLRISQPKRRRGLCQQPPKFLFAVYQSLSSQSPAITGQIECEKAQVSTHFRTDRKDWIKEEFFRMTEKQWNVVRWGLTGLLALCGYRFRPYAPRLLELL